MQGTMSILLAIGSDIDARLAAVLLEPLHQPMVIARTAAEAESQARAHSFAVSLIDTGSLDGSGIDLMHMLRSRGSDSFTIVINPAADVVSKVEMLTEGADDYLVYPYEPAELFARVHGALRRHQRREGSVEGAIVRVGTVQLDVNELEVSVLGKPSIRLTPNEMRLLLYLMTHAQRAVDQQELLLHLLGAGALVTESNAVSVYVRRIRCKIEQNPNQPSYIVTVRGHGYQFQSLEEDATSTPPSSDPF